MKQLINADIIVRCKNGDKSAFRAIVEAYNRQLFSLAMRMLGDEDEAKDAVQEAFIKAWLNLLQYNERKDFGTWIYTIASRICLDRLKRIKPLQPLPEDERMLHDFCSQQTPHKQLENKQWIAIMRLLVQDLSDRQRLVFTLSSLEGLESKEIEEMTGMDATQIKSNLYHAKKAIRERLKHFGYE